MNGYRKTFVILIPGFPANEADSTCLPFPQAFVRNFKQLNPSLHVVVLAFQYPFSRRVYNWHGVEVHAFNGRGRGNLRRLLLWGTVWKCLGRIMKKEQVMGILSFWLGECAFMAKYASRKFSTRSFTWLLGQDAREGNRYFSYTKPRRESLIALSDFISDEFQRNYHQKPAHTIPPGIDVNRFPQNAPERGIDILGAGSLIPLKQFEQFIQLVSRLARIKPEIRAVICGEGPEREKLQQMINDHRLNGQIELPGELDHEKVLEYMKSSKIFLHPSSYEGFSTVCAEALYAGCHVVSYCKPMHILYSHMYVVDSEDEMTQTVNKLLDNKSLDHDPVLTFPIQDSCKTVLSLYN